MLSLLILLYTLFDRKRTPFVYPLLTNGPPFAIVNFRTLHTF